MHNFLQNCLVNSIDFTDLERGLKIVSIMNSLIQKAIKRCLSKNIKRTTWLFIERDIEDSGGLIYNITNTTS